MIVAVQGTKDFDDYSIFIRAMGVAMCNMRDSDKEFVIYSAGPTRVNSFVSEFSNLSERGMKARGRKIKFYKVANAWLEENINQIDYVAFLSKPKESASRLVDLAEKNNVEVGLFRF
jgi:hypothetical protein